MKRGGVVLARLLAGEGADLCTKELVGPARLIAAMTAG